MKRELRVQLLQQDAGILWENQGQLHFGYDSSYTSSTGAVEISPHFPLQQDPFNGPQVDHWFSGLLPHGAGRKQIAKRLGVADHDTLGLLDRLGGDCVGAIAFPAASQMQLFDEEYQEIQWLSEQELKTILEDLPRQALLAGRSGLRATLPFSAPVLPVILEDGKLALPCAGHPSTHILQHAADQDSAKRHIVAAALAERMKIPCSNVSWGELPGTACYVLHERGDRTLSDRNVTPVHGESLPQSSLSQAAHTALAKGFTEIRQRAHPPAPALITLLDQILFNVLIGNEISHYDWTLLRLPSERSGLTPWAGFHLSGKDIALPWLNKKRQPLPANSAWAALADSAQLSRAQTRQRAIKRAGQFSSALERLDFAALGFARTPGLAAWLQELAARAASLNQKLG